MRAIEIGCIHGIMECVFIREGQMVSTYLSVVVAASTYVIFRNLFALVRKSSVSHTAEYSSLMTRASVMTHHKLYS